MRRKAENSVGSLELLLDTMCNTFGGVVFIAILLSVLSSAMGTGGITPEQAQALPADLQQDLREAAEQTRLETRARQLLEVLKRQQTVSTAASRPAAAPPLAAAATPAALQAQLETTEAELKQATAATAQLERESLLVSAQLDTAEKKAAALRAQERRTELGQGRPLRLPRLHEVKNKRTVILALQGKRFYAVQNVAVKYPLPRAYDLDEVSIRKKAFGTDANRREVEVVEMQPEAGQRVLDGAEKEGKLRLALNNLDPKQEYVVFGVAPDSFAEFNYLKRLFVEKGFDYQWQPLTGPMGVVPGTAVGQ